MLRRATSGARRAAEDCARAQVHWTTFHVKHPDPLDHLNADLAELQARGLRRSPPEPEPPEALSFCSNDYLGLAGLDAPPAPSGAGASRLIAGERVEHRRLERALAEWLGAEDALAFSSGYAANVGVLAALAGPADLIVSDALNHASLIDGARLARARVVVTPHLDLGAVEAALKAGGHRRAWVVCESYYSMDADGPDLAALRRLCDAHGAALIVDEAHALGVLGPAGRGRCAEAGVRPDVLVGTLGKALGAQGAFVAGRAVLRDWLWNRARSFVFSTGLAPVCAGAALRNLGTVLRDPDRSRTVGRLADRLRAGLRSAGAVSARPGGGLPVLLGFGHVVPLVVGSPAGALELAARMREGGVAVQAVRPPTVPEGTARVRLTVTARHQEADIDRAVEVCARAVRELAP